MHDALTAPDYQEPNESSNHSKGRLRWSVQLFLLTAYLVAAGLLGASRSGNHEPALSHSAKGLLIVCGLEAGIFAVVFGVAWLFSRATSEDLLLRWRGGFWSFPLGVAYSVALRVALLIIAAFAVTVLIATHVLTLEGIKHFAQENRPDLGAVVDFAALRHNPVYFVLTITVVSFGLAGLREELWRAAVLASLRQLWPNRFGSTKGAILAVGIAAIVFGAGHLAMGPIAVCLAGLLGFGLGLIMVLHRSIWPAVIAHGMFDATTFALLPLLMDRLPSFS